MTQTPDFDPGMAEEMNVPRLRAAFLKRNAETVARAPIGSPCSHGSFDKLSLAGLPFQLVAASAARNVAVGPRIGIPLGTTLSRRFYYSRLPSPGCGFRVDPLPEQSRTCSVSTRGEVDVMQFAEE